MSSGDWPIATQTVCLDMCVSDYRGDLSFVFFLLHFVRLSRLTNEALQWYLIFPFVLYLDSGCPFDIEAYTTHTCVRVRARTHTHIHACKYIDVLIQTYTETQNHREREREREGEREGERERERGREREGEREGERERDTRTRTHIYI